MRRADVLTYLGTVVLSTLVPTLIAVAEPGGLAAWRVALIGAAVGLVLGVIFTWIAADG